MSHPLDKARRFLVEVPSSSQAPEMHALWRRLLDNLTHPYARLHPLLLGQVVHESLPKTGCRCTYLRFVETPSREPNSSPSLPLFTTPCELHP